MSDTNAEMALAVLRQFWGYNSFRPGQLQTIVHVLDGKDVLAVLPTGTGKSVCYQVPAIIADGVTVVVSPLVALMRDQVDRLRSLGIPAELLASTTSKRQKERIRVSAVAGNTKLLYVSPERLRRTEFQEWADRLEVSLLAVDEAHCISEWGHGFRPSYRLLSSARHRFGDPPVLALTATATPRIRRDIQRSLRLRSAEVTTAGFDRPNLDFGASWSPSRHRRLLSLLSRVAGSAIVYAATRRSTEAWAAWLTHQGHFAQAYHAGLPAGVRNRVQDRWTRADTRIVVATSAFGMGVDKSDVRLVVHVHLPPSLESYYQQAGRAGRDGLQAEVRLLCYARDIARARRLAATGTGRETGGSGATNRLKQALRYRRAMERLSHVVKYAATRSCRRNFILTYFGDNPADSCEACDNCRSTARPPTGRMAVRQ